MSEWQPIETFKPQHEQEYLAQDKHGYEFICQYFDSGDGMKYFKILGDDNDFKYFDSVKVQLMKFKPLFDNPEATA